MSVLSIAATSIVCDGVGGFACPELSVLTYHHPQSVSIRLARQEGWAVGIDVACPHCSRSGVGLPAVSPLPAINRVAAA